MPVRERVRAAALVLGVLAVLGTLAALIAGPGAVAGTQARSATASSSTGPARTAAGHIPATWARSDFPLTAARTVRVPAAAVAQALRGQALAAASRAADHLRHGLPGVAALPAALVVAGLALTGLALAVGDGRASRRTSIALRGRAPPAPALA